MWARKAVLAIRTAITSITSRLTTIENAGYQTSSDVSAAIAAAIGGVTELEYLVVSTLPATGSKGVIYLVPHQHDTRDIYDEYIWVNNAFEKIGSTDVDLSQYLLKTDISAWAKAPTKPTYTAAEVGALPDDTVIPTVPTKVSAFTNDAGYITGYTETDPTVPAWAKASTKPTYTASEVGALPDTTVIPTVPTNVSAFNNDAGYLTSAPVTSVNSKTGAVNLTASDVGALPSSTVIPSASSATPAMDGTGAAGSSADYARADHVHPHDTSKADAATTYTKSQVDALIPTVPSASTSNPVMDGTAAAGTSTDYARADHVHPSDTSKQNALSAAQLAAVNSGITADDLAVNNVSVLCSVTPIEPILDAGSHSSSYGGCYYYKSGCTVTVHLGVSGLTASTDTVLFTLPAGYRPHARIAFVGIGGSLSSYSRFRIDTNGQVHVHSGATSALGYITFDAFS